MTGNVEDMSDPKATVTADRKRYWIIFLKSLGVGCGLAIGISLIGWGIVWYTSRPKPSKPWDTKALTAEYRYIDTFGQEKHLAFCYVLQNNTAYDYNLTEYKVSHLGAHLAAENGISEESEGFLKGVYPAFIPAKGRARFCLHVEYPATLEKPTDSATAEERKTFQKALEKFATDEFANLNGFELFDEDSRYEILFPAGWREDTKAR